jgi:hypothetical protein
MSLTDRGFKWSADSDFPIVQQVPSVHGWLNSNDHSVHLENPTDCNANLHLLDSDAYVHNNIKKKPKKTKNVSLK